MYTPCGGRTHSLGEEGVGGSIVRKTPDTAFYSIYVSTLCRQWTVGGGGGIPGISVWRAKPQRWRIRGGGLSQSREGLAVNRLLCRTQVHGATWGLLTWAFNTTPPNQTVNHACQTKPWTKEIIKKSPVFLIKNFFCNFKLEGLSEVTIGQTKSWITLAKFCLNSYWKYVSSGFKNSGPGRDYVGFWNFLRTRFFLIHILL